jgi:hypothetical protein
MQDNFWNDVRVVERDFCSASNTAIQMPPAHMGVRRSDPKSTIRVRDA